METTGSGMTMLAPSGGMQGLPLSPATLLSGVVLVASLCHAIMPVTVDEGLALVPHHTIFSPIASLPFPFVWNVVTAHLFEASFWRMVFMVPAIASLAQRLERLWSARGFALHVVLTCAASSFVVFVWEVVEVFRTAREKDFFLPTRGCCGLLVCLAVGLRHAYPLEALPVVPKAWGLQCQHLPFAIAAAAVVVGILGPSWLLPEWPFAPLALFFAWLHLRYVMWFPHAKAYGDHSPDFCFANLFPTGLRPVVSGLGAVLHNFVATVAPDTVRIRQPEDEAERAEAGSAIVFDPSRDAAAGGAVLWNSAGAMSLAGAMSSSAAWPAPPPLPSPAGAPPVPGAPGSKEYDARRAKALKLLDENISSLLRPSPAMSAVPSLAAADAALAVPVAAVAAVEPLDEGTTSTAFPEAPRLDRLDAPTTPTADVVEPAVPALTAAEPSDYLMNGEVEVEMSQTDDQSQLSTA
eukprot:gb/GFBE01018471.1/.p1 GENE.gb/GFBE01018471.1/~~gb/GFBE01018471.1/.p1  ORF type:complete len:465 (+),score=65.79 gb/GFBE01018471.1/:1-1395(+)